ncbi:hypothetical protein [Nocardia sp. CA-135398]
MPEGVHVEVEEYPIVSLSGDVDKQTLRDITGRVHLIGWPT